jgi:hypothetical protein
VIPRLQPAGFASESSVEALTVAMALAPGVYTRNRMFEFFAQPAVRRARSRAAILRGIVRHLPRACGVSLEEEGRDADGVPSYVLRYRVAEMLLSRVTELTRIELAALRLLAARAQATTAAGAAAAASALPVEAEDHEVVAAALSRLMLADTESRDLAQAATDSVAPPPRG